MTPTMVFLSSHCIPLVLRFFLISSFLFSKHSAYPSSTAYGGTTWRNDAQSLDSLTLAPLTVRPILVATNISYDGLSVRFGSGFLCYTSNCKAYLFGIFFAIYDPTETRLFDLQMVWSANRNRLVHDNAILELSSTGDLVLTDADGSLVWSTNTFTHDFQGLRIQERGNLVLFNNSNGTMWQSFDHPTDRFLVGQKFGAGQKLIADSSPTNTSEGIFSASLLGDKFAMFVGVEEPQIYFTYTKVSVSARYSYMQFENEWLYFYGDEGLSSQSNLSIPKNSLQLRIDSNGHLRFYSFLRTTGSSEIDYLLDYTQSLSACDYPKSCGDYGICTDGQCSCPRITNGAEAFRQLDESKPNLGCVPSNHLLCSQTSTGKGMQFLEQEHVSYFTFSWENSSIPELITRDVCKYLCLQNCSCKAAFFRYDSTIGGNFSHGYCHLESKVYTLKLIVNPNDQFYNSTAYIKVQSSSKNSKTSEVTISVVGAVVGVIILILLLWVWITKSRRRREEKEKDPEDSVDWLAGLPSRYLYEDLQKVTGDFKTKLGSGGFGSVFEGVMPDGTKIAVKRLDRAGQGSKEFRAEVETLGNIHHLNLVRLKGFCAEKTHRILVYEHLPNGSLDKWIFPNKDQLHVLDWKTRSKVALQIARGLTYLHEECRERIIHFDIKPQNILLDENFNAKVSDFGLSKLINREQSEVITMTKGTFGYMAPELLNLHVTEKADTYSFGVVVVEIVCGKRSKELSTAEYSLLSILQQEAREGRLRAFIDPQLREEGMDVEEEALRMMEVGMWCLQEDFERRPAMSTVVKALEGLIEIEDVSSSESSSRAVTSHQQCSSPPESIARVLLSEPISSSVLSGPR
uniref:Receptor-like serine/threonine-protein kinase n=1 Tax=Araucaria cunninghamii TaxID=56994 RepID=A0A0D6QR37_ARACU